MKCLSVFFSHLELVMGKKKKKRMLKNRILFILSPPRPWILLPSLGKYRQRVVHSPLTQPPLKYSVWLTSLPLPVTFSLCFQVSSDPAEREEWEDGGRKEGIQNKYVRHLCTSSGGDSGERSNNELKRERDGRMKGWVEGWDWEWFWSSTHDVSFLDADNVISGWTSDDFFKSSSKKLRQLHWPAHLTDLQPVKLGNFPFDWATN